MTARHFRRPAKRHLQTGLHSLFQIGRREASLSRPSDQERSWSGILQLPRAAPREHMATAGRPEGYEAVVLKLPEKKKESREKPVIRGGMRQLE